MPALADLPTNPVRAVGLPITFIQARWVITGGAGAVGSTTGSDPGVTVTRTGVGAYRVDYPQAPAQAFPVGVYASAGAQPTAVTAETAGQLAVTFAADPAAATVIYATITASPSRY